MGENAGVLVAGGRDMRLSTSVDCNDVSPYTEPTSPTYQSYKVNNKKQGDVEKEKEIEERLGQLGLLESKRNFEKQIAEKLDACLEQDDLVGALNRCRRRRILKDRVSSATSEIQNIIRSNVMVDANGVKSHSVKVLMGIFTKDVVYKVSDYRIIITGNAHTSQKLSKEVVIEFPEHVDMSGLAASFKAGMFQAMVPFKPNGGSVSSESSSDYSPGLDLTNSSPWSSDVDL